MSVEQEFFASMNRYTHDSELQQTRWKEIASGHTRPDRHYHNLTHLNALLHELEPYREKFTNWDVVIFAIVYHDLVYNTLKGNNEEASAAIAVERLRGISFPENLIVICERMILATRTHEARDPETNLFTDADLSILGADPEMYQEYAKQVRREWRLYPDIVYNPGRKKVLRRFMDMARIYKTDEFFNKYEQKARANILREIDSL